MMQGNVIMVLVVIVLMSFVTEQTFVEATVTDCPTTRAQGCYDSCKQAHRSSLCIKICGCSRFVDTRFTILFCRFGCQEWECSKLDESAEYYVDEVGRCNDACWELCHKVYDPYGSLQLR
ncbi:hypothetical protein ACHQM5_030009 [Ranunculus cassubicifolius]